MRKIDGHLHLRRDPSYLKQVLRSYDRFGVERAFAFGLGDPLDETTNAGTLETCRGHRDRLVPFAFFHLGIDKPGQVVRLAGQGFRGLKMIWPLRGYDHEYYWPVYGEAQRLGLPLLFHTGIVLRSSMDRRYRISSSNMRPVCLDAVARSFPGLRLILAHLGTPWQDEAFMLARVHPNVYLDVSSGSGWISKGMGPAWFKEKIGWWDGFRKFLFAVDMPHTQMGISGVVREWTRILSHCRTPKATREAFWSGNAASLLDT